MRKFFLGKKTIFCEAMSGVVFCLTFLAISHGEIIKWNHKFQVYLKNFNIFHFDVFNTFSNFGELLST